MVDIHQSHDTCDLQKYDHTLAPWCTDEGMLEALCHTPEVAQGESCHTCTREAL